jgi:outer membrane protein OmpA-like peptidoglycan-associated protein
MKMPLAISAAVTTLLSATSTFATPNGHSVALRGPAQQTVLEANSALMQNAFYEQEIRFQALEEEVVAKLTFQILFATGSDTLSEIDMQRVHALATHLNRNPELRVVLDGYADPRGTDEYNNVLARERARAVKDALEVLGVAPDRIRYQGHGNRFSRADKGDEEAYRLERRVDITLEVAAPAYAHF